MDNTPPTTPPSPLSMPSSYLAQVFKLVRFHRASFPTCENIPSTPPSTTPFLTLCRRRIFFKREQGAEHQRGHKGHGYAPQYTHHYAPYYYAGYYAQGKAQCGF